MLVNGNERSNHNLHMAYLTDSILTIIDILTLEYCLFCAFNDSSNWCISRARAHAFEFLSCFVGKESV